MIAIVQRPRRKAHLAHDNLGGAAWLTVCDRDVLAAGATVQPLRDVLDTIDADADQVCVHCQRIILMAGVVAKLWATAALAVAA